jgi:hypothetical protein
MMRNVFLKPRSEPLPSERRGAANRANAKKSTGPKSLAGKRRSGRNAFRHGLAIGIDHDTSLSGPVEQLISVMASQAHLKQTPLLRQLAEVEFDLLRIRKVRATIFEANFSLTDAATSDYRTLNTQLAKLERYERRAMSRHKRVLRAISRPD